MFSLCYICGMNHITEDHWLAAENRLPHPVEIPSGLSPLCPPINRAVMVEIFVTVFDLKESLFEWWDIVAVASGHKSFTCWILDRTSSNIPDVWKAKVLMTSRYILTSYPTCYRVQSLSCGWRDLSLCATLQSGHRQVHYLHHQRQPTLCIIDLQKLSNPPRGISSSVVSWHWTVIGAGLNTFTTSLIDY